MENGVDPCVSDRIFQTVALIGFSRMYLYVHYPTDILGGILVGIVAGYIGYIVVNRCGTIQNR